MALLTQLAPRHRNEQKRIPASRCLLATAFLVLAALSSVPGSAAASANLGEPNTTALSAGLVGYWSMDGNTINWSTGTIRDLSNNANTGFIASLSTTTAPVVGKIGSALNFHNDNNQYIYNTAPSNLPSISGPKTISAWIKLNSTGLYQDIVTLQNACAGGSAGDQLRFNSSNQLEMSHFGGGITLDSNATFSANTWYFVTYTYDGTTNKFYINGVLDSSNTTGSPSGSTGAFVIGNYGGSSSNCSGGTEAFDGIIDDVRIYNHALSPQEIALLYAVGQVHVGESNTTSGTRLNSGLLGYWTFDGPTVSWTTDTAKDSSGNGNTGTLVSFATSSSPTAGKIGQALKFNGSSSYIDFPTNVPFNNDVGPLSIALWFKTTGTGILVDDADHTIANFTSAVGWDPLLYIETTGVLHAGGYIGSPPNLVTTAAENDGKWHYVVYINNGAASQTQSLYVDGTFIGSVTATMTTVGTPSDWNIGAGITGSGWPNSGTGTGPALSFFNGTIDDVRVYNRALSAQEIEQLYASGKVSVGETNTSSSAGINSGLVGYWSFDGRTINWATGIVNDVSNSGALGQLQNMSTTTSPVIGKIGQALSFNGANQYVSITVNKPFGDDVANDTVSAWFKTTGDGVIVSNNDAPVTSTPSNFDPLLYIETTGYLQAGGYTGGFPTALQSTVPLNDGRWHFAAVTYNGSTQALYVDGAFVASASGARSGVGSPDYWMIGNGYSNFWGNTNNTWFYFNGSIDDVRVYNRVLSAQEVEQLYLTSK